MNWVNKSKLSAIEAIKYNDHLCIKTEDLWDALYSTFNRAQDHWIDSNLLNKFPNKFISS